MAKIEGKCKEIMDKADWIAIATAGTHGPHLAATWGDYVRKIGLVNDELVLVPMGGFRATERNLTVTTGSVLFATKFVPSAQSLAGDAESGAKATLKPPESALIRLRKHFPGRGEFWR